MNRIVLILSLAVMLVTMLISAVPAAALVERSVNCPPGTTPVPDRPGGDPTKGRCVRLPPIVLFEQEAESGDIVQTFDVSQTGDNSNQCVGITDNANTGNAQNQIGLTQYFSDADDFDDTGADLTVTGTSTTTCDQQVNQAAAAG